MTGAGAVVLGFRESISSVPRYVPDWTGQDRSRYLRLDRNESTRPPSAAVLGALRRAIAGGFAVSGYPDSARLTGRLAGYCGVRPANVLATNGSDQAIDICLRGFLSPGDTMLVVRPEFPVYGHVAAVLGAHVHGIPHAAGFEFPYDKFRRAAREGRARLIVFINPNNPTGTPVAADYIREVARANPGTPVIVDEAYYEYTGTTVAGDIAGLPNLIVLRTFSKAFALAGLRVGYIIAHRDVIDYVSRLRNEFDVNALALVAAEAQLAALDEVRSHVTEVMESVKPKAVDFFRRHGIEVWPGAANFMLVGPADRAGAIDHLYRAGILVRPMRAPGLAGTFRMSLGTHEEMTRFYGVYEEMIVDGPGTRRGPGNAGDGQ